MRLLHRLKSKIVNFLLGLVVLIYILFEELIWERFAEPIVAYIKTTKILEKLPKIIQRLDNRVIFIFFIVLFAVAEVLGVYAGVIALKGNIFLAILLYALKIPLAAFAFWLFNESKEKLLKFEWFKRVYLFIIKWIEILKESQIYLSVKEKSHFVKAYIKEYLPRGKSSIIKKAKAIYRYLKGKF